MMQKHYGNVLNENDCVHRTGNNETAQYSVQNSACKAILNKLHKN